MNATLKSVIAVYSASADRAVSGGDPDACAASAPHQRCAGQRLRIGNARRVAGSERDGIFPAGQFLRTADLLLENQYRRRDVPAGGKSGGVHPQLLTGRKVFRPARREI